MTVDDLLNTRIGEIRQRFPGLTLEFSTRDFGEHAELWVYVFDMQKFEEVKKYCQELEKSPLEPRFPIWILVKTWTGPWPGGESVQKIKIRREAFLAKVKQGSHSQETAR